MQTSLTVTPGVVEWFAHGAVQNMSSDPREKHVTPTGIILACDLRLTALNLQAVNLQAGSVTRPARQGEPNA